jgi:hypothetical protein
MSSPLTRLAIIVVLATGPVAAQDASLTVIHGIPGLPAPVEVLVDGVPQFSFDFGDTVGPVNLPPATYLVEVQLQGTTVLMANPTLAAGANYSAVAHLLEGGGINLALFQNDISALASGDSRVAVRHLADAPAVDVLVRRFFSFMPYSALTSGLSNGQEAAADVPVGLYRAKVNAAGTSTTVAGPVFLSLPPERSTIVYAIGALGSPSFQLLKQSINLSTTTLMVQVSGTTPGGMIGIDTMNPDFGVPFNVTLSGGTPGASAFLHIGSSSTNFLFFPLPLDLSFIGAPGNFLYQNSLPDSATQLDAGGNGSVSLTIPPSLQPYFNGAYFQYTYIDPQANALGIVFSDLLSILPQ